MNPALLPKVRSDAIMGAAHGQPCTLRIASFVGKSCAGPDTTVACHVTPIGKGVATKGSDLGTAFGCAICHDIIDGRDSHARGAILQNYPAAFAGRLLAGLCETQAILVAQGIIVVPDATII